MKKTRISLVLLSLLSLIGFIGVLSMTAQNDTMPKDWIGVFGRLMTFSIAANVFLSCRYAWKTGRSAVLWGIGAFLFPYILPAILAFMKTEFSGPEIESNRAPETQMAPADASRKRREANGNARDSDLIAGAEEGDLDKVTAVVDRGVNVNTTDSNGASALMLASFNGFHELAFYLIGQNADVRHADHNGFNALMLACESALPDIGLVRRLIELGSDVNASSSGGSTSLMAAAKSGHLELVELLIAKGARINVANTEHGVTPLIWAASCGHLAIVKLLLVKGADRNARTVNNYTASSIAAENGHYEIVSLFE